MLLQMKLIHLTAVLDPSKSKERSILDFRGLGQSIGSGVAPGIFRRGLTLPTRGLNMVFGPSEDMKVIFSEIFGIYWQ